MAGHINTLTFNSRHREAAAWPRNSPTLVESMGEPEMTVGLLYGAGQAKWEAGEAVESLRLAQIIVDLADGDLTKGNFLIGSPLAWATMVERAARMFLGRRGWRADMEKGIELAKSFDPNTRALAQLYRFAGVDRERRGSPHAADIAPLRSSLEMAAARATTPP